MDTQAVWSGVRERVIAVVEAERRARGQGPSQLPVFEPVLSAAEIAEVEAQYGVALPHEYRTFLAEVGAGGTGPGVELTPLRRVGGIWVWDCDSFPLQLDPGRPFVETEAWAEQQRATLRAAGREPTTRDPDDDYLDDYLEAFGEAGMEAFIFERVRGAILICENGCGLTSWLIIVGPRSGELRDRDCAFNPPFDPYLDVHGNRHTFRTWYLEWLEQFESKARHRER
jgi:hypothetical protein